MESNNRTDEIRRNGNQDVSDRTYYWISISIPLMHFFRENSVIYQFEFHPCKLRIHSKHPTTKLRRGNVFSRVCLSVHGGRGSNVTITHGALDFTVKALTPPLPRHSLFFYFSDLCYYLTPCFPPVHCAWSPTRSRGLMDWVLCYLFPLCLCCWDAFLPLVMEFCESRIWQISGRWDLD